MTKPRGSLILVPNTLDFGIAAGAPDVQDVLPASVIRAAARLTHWVAENAKTTRAFLKRVDTIVHLAVHQHAGQIRGRPHRQHRGRCENPHRRHLLGRGAKHQRLTMNANPAGRRIGDVILKIKSTVSVCRQALFFERSLKEFSRSTQSTSVNKPKNIFDE